MFVESKKPIEKVIKKALANMSKKELKKHIGVLHACKEKPKTRARILKKLGEKDLVILSICLNKSKVYTKLQDEKHVLYNYVANILLDRIFSKKLISTKNPITLVASRRETNKFLNQNFSSYLKNQAESNHKIEIKVKIKPPESEECLQAVDFICWAIYQKRERNDESYFELIKSKVLEERQLFP
jgi:hypothetical protein